MSRGLAKGRGAFSIAVRPRADGLAPRRCLECISYPYWCGSRRRAHLIGIHQRFPRPGPLLSGTRLLCPLRFPQYMRSPSARTAERCALSLCWSRCWRSKWKKLQLVEPAKSARRTLFGLRRFYRPATGWDGTRIASSAPRRQLTIAGEYGSITKRRVAKPAEVRRWRIWRSPR